jgi:hypothetical protein
MAAPLNRHGMKAAHAGWRPWRTEARQIVFLFILHILGGLSPSADDTRSACHNK